MLHSAIEGLVSSTAKPPGSATERLNAGSRAAAKAKPEN